MQKGNLTKVGENKYRYRVMVNGITYNKVIEANSLKNANIAAGKIYYEIQNKMFCVNSNMKFYDLADEYFNQYYKVNFREEVVKSVRGIINNHIIPFWGNYKLEEISPRVVNLFINELKNTNSINKGKKLSNKSIKNYYDVFKAIMNYAVRMEYISSNPCNKLSLNLVQKKNDDIKFYNESQVRLLLAAIKEEKVEYQVAILLALICGLRKSEVYGIQWEDIDFENKTIHICRGKIMVKLEN